MRKCSARAIIETVWDLFLKASLSVLAIGGGLKTVIKISEFDMNSKDAQKYSGSTSDKFKYVVKSIF